MGFSVPVPPALFSQHAQGLGREVEYREEGGPGERRDHPTYPCSSQVHSFTEFVGLSPAEEKFLTGGFPAQNIQFDTRVISKALTRDLKPTYSKNKAILS